MLTRLASEARTGFGGGFDFETGSHSPCSLGWSQTKDPPACLASQVFFFIIIFKYLFYYYM